MAKKQNFQDLYDEYLEDEEINAEIEAQIENEETERKIMAEAGDELSRLDKERVSQNSNVSN